MNYQNFVSNLFGASILNAAQRIHEAQLAEQNEQKREQQMIDMVEDYIEEA